MFHLYFLLSLSVESAKFCKSCTVPALFKVHQKCPQRFIKSSRFDLSAMAVLLLWNQVQFCEVFSLWLKRPEPIQIVSQVACQPPLSKVFVQISCLNSFAACWMCLYICVYKFLYVMSCDFRMPGCFTRCGDTLWEKSEQPWRPEARTERRPCSIRSLDFFGADVFQEMWDRSPHGPPGTRAHGHTGIRAIHGHGHGHTGTRAIHGHTDTQPNDGHTGTRAIDRHPGTRARAHSQSTGIGIKETQVTWRKNDNIAAE